MYWIHDGGKIERVYALEPPREEVIRCLAVMNTHECVGGLFVLVRAALADRHVPLAELRPAEAGAAPA